MKIHQVVIFSDAIFAFSITNLFIRSIRQWFKFF